MDIKHNTYSLMALCMKEFVNNSRNEFIIPIVFSLCIISQLINNLITDGYYRCIVFYICCCLCA